jgi:hypothetical protein
MISDCAYCGILELNDAAFLQDTFALLVLIAPGAICFTLWRIFVTNKSGPRGGIVILGLDDSSSTYSDLSLSGISMYLRALYCSTCILTFVIGLLTSEAFKLLGKIAL